MKALENRTQDSKREMDILDALQDIRARNARNERVGQSVDLVARVNLEEIEREEDEERKRQEEEDEKLVKEAFAKRAQPPANGVSAASTTGHKRKADDTPSLQSLLPESTRALIQSKTSAPSLVKKPKTSGDVKKSLGIKVVKKNGAKPT